MNSTWMRGAVLACLLFAATSFAEASVGSALGKVWSYLFTPVNCIAQAGVDLVALGAKLVQCVLSNANPQNLIP